MRVTVIGTGYVGTVTGACLAWLGHRVTCVDTDAAKIQKLQGGVSPIYEPHLEQLLKLAPLRGGLDFSTELAPAARASDIIFIAVGTPPRPNGDADLSYLEAAARGIGSAMDSSRFRVVVNKSTVPVGCGNLVETLVREGIAESGCGNGSAVAFGVASNPEFLREGSAVADSLYPDRIVVGASDTQTLELMRQLYAPLVEQRFDPPPAVPRPAGFGPRPAAGRLPHQRGDDQVRRQRLPGPQDRLRQRNGQYLRAGGRGSHRGDAGHRPRFPHRRQVPEPGHRLGRKLLPQGHQCAAFHRPRVRLREPPAFRLSRSQRRPASSW